MKSENNAAGFVKTLNLFDATAVVAGAMIGSGIFIVSSGMARDVKSAGLLLLLWLIAGVMTIIGALCYGEYAVIWPHAGGQYVYLKKIWGDLLGFLYGWTFCWVIQSGTIAAVSIAFAKFLGILFPIINDSNNLFKFYGLTVSYQELIAILLIIFLAAVNKRGVKISSLLQNSVMVSNIAAFAGIILCGLFLGMKPDVLSYNFSHVFSASSLHTCAYSAMGVALIGALFAFDGWNNLTFIAAEIKNTERNLPLALLLGTGMVVVLYLLTNFVYLGALPLESVQNAKDGIVGAAFMQAILGTYGKIIISIVILISSFGCVNSMILAGSRVCYAMAKDGLFFKSISELGEKSGVPERAITLQCTWSIILVLSGTYFQLLDYLMFASILFYLLTIFGLFNLRKNYSHELGTYKTWGYPYTPIIYCILGMLVEINLLITEPKYAGLGLLIVLTGIPVYVFWRKLSATEEIQEITEQIEANDDVQEIE